MTAAARKKAWKSAGSLAASSSRASGKRHAADMNAKANGVMSEVFVPSHNTIPMKLPANVASTTLAFGKGSTFKKRKTEASAVGVPGAFERAMATEEAVLARRKANDAKAGNQNSPRPTRQKASLQKELERHWSEETRDVLGTFQAMRQELLQRKQDAGLLGADIVLTREYSYYDLVGSAQLASIELELADVLTSVREAENRAKRLVAIETQQEDQSNTQDSTASTENPSEAQKHSQSQRAEIISKAVQDAALMRELSRIIRCRALEMSESRKGGYRL